MREYIRSLQFSQTSIIKSILQIHAAGQKTFDCDPCFNKGAMYGHGIPLPRYKFDINPIHPECMHSNALALPLGDKKLSSLIIDPPFILGKSKNKMTDLYTSFTDKNEMFHFFECMISEAYRVLKDNGLFVVKIQDLNNNRRRVFSSHFIRSAAFAKGFNLIDEFILGAKSRMIGPSHNNRYGSRSFHCFFLVFRKKRSRTKYARAP